MPDPAPMLVVAPNWLGDAVMALPAMADVARRRPGAPPLVAARPSIAPLFSLTPWLGGVITLESRGAAPQASRRRDLERLGAAGAAAALLLPNSFASAWLVRAAGVRERWGYASDLRRPLLTRAVARPRGSMHQARYYQHLVRALGFESGPLEPRLEVPAAAVAAARELLASRGWDGARPLLVLAPGAAYGTAKRWLPGHFARLAAMAIDQRGAHCALVGSAGDRETAAWVQQAVAPAVRGRVADLTGATTLPVLAGVLRLAAACVSNDSGAMHLAGAVGAPLAAIFGPTREYETAPLTRDGRGSDVLTNPVWCRPCMLRECPIDHRCMTHLEPPRVFASVARLMDDTAS